ncbi:heme acquisition protein HasR [Hephaestia caeni]|uniref:Heme acquisition protein HasR n=1 Tax=Hephaestia caeni TaxID=645617 RepID=A0A397PB75_9SPHN|nr:TonB-dependent receptor [Hephaestia caeni]RIA46208.1 heme acquisition protein HasR [Hephaestia caeni]
MISGGIFKKIGNRRLWAGALLASVSVGGLSLPMTARAQEVATEATRSFDIAPQLVVDALADFGRQSGLQVSLDADQVRGLSTQGVKGTMTPAQALDRLLASTGFAGRIEGRIVSLQRVSITAAEQRRSGTVELGPLRVEGEQAGGSGGIGRNGRVGAGGVAGGADEIFAAPRAVSIVTREELDRTPARHAADLITEVPGVTSAVNRLNPGLSVNIRGMQDFGRVNMMIDGMRQNFVQNGHQQRNGQMYVDPELISGVTIERGPRTSVHGMSAIAGSVNFTTLGFEDLLDGEADRIGVRLRGNTGLGGEGNGVNFLGSAAIAGRLTDNLEVLAAYSRRDIGDYDIGTKGGVGNSAFEFLGANGLQSIGRIRYASQLQNSALAKARLTLAEDHVFQLSYIGTWIDYDNVSDSRSHALDENESPWRRLGESNISSENFAFDYSWKPDSNWIDLRLKLYHVNTRNRNFTEPREHPTTPALTDTAWRLGYCEQTPIPASWQTACQYGYSTDHTIRTKTYGVQIDNTSSFDIGQDLKLNVNYGGEYFQDRSNSDVVAARDGREVLYNQYGQGDPLNPRGRRSMGGLFAKATLESPLYTLSAGLRYDHWWLKGETQVLGVVTEYQDRFARFLSYMCSLNTAAAIANCQGARAGGEAWARAALPSWFTGNAPVQRPGWVDRRDFYDYDVDRSEGRFLPSIEAAIRPTSWLEFYGSWAKSWRPPAINESLMVGGHPGDPLANMFPNPFADPEKTTTWELGANLSFNNLFKSDDVFFAKVGYFNTRARDYLFTSMNNNLPGHGMNIPLGLGNVMFVNNRTPMRFQGFEIEARYDVGFLYGGVAATLYTGKRNRFSQDLYPAGSGTSRFDQPNEDGSITPERQMALDAGFPSWQAWAEAQVFDQAAVFNSVSGAMLDKVSANIGVRLFDRRLDTGIRLIHSGSGGLLTWSDDETGNAWESYTTFDWYGSFTLNDRFRFFASIENLTDRRYIDARGDIFSQTWAPGHTVTGGLQVKF